jgi:hypothetical protein
MIGMYHRHGVSMAFLARGDEIIGVRVGELLLPGYRIVAITDEQLRMRSEATGHELMVPL